MFTEVQGKPVRGILEKVSYRPLTGQCYGDMVSDDFCYGEKGRNNLEQGWNIYTSTVLAFDCVEGQLVIVTKNSAYIVEGVITIGHERVPSRSETGLS